MNDPTSPPKAPDLAVRVRDLGVTYRTTYELPPTAARTSQWPLRRRRAVKEVEALNSVSFDLPRNEILGVVGVNGAGKSTLLRVIAGILPPTTGRVEIYGQVSTLLALGLGFNKNLSGRENVLLGGMTAGLSPEMIEEQFDEIVAFADIGDFIDLPVRTYSSGMRGRLAFAVSVHMRPDILLIDEALSAGDAAFKKKAARKIRELCDETGTIILVSHGTETIRTLSTSVLLLHNGQQYVHGEPNEVVDYYERRQGIDGRDAVVREDV